MDKYKYENLAKVSTHHVGENWSKNQQYKIQFANQALYWISQEGGDESSYYQSTNKQKIMKVTEIQR